MSKARNQLSSVIIDLVSDDDKIKESMIKLNKDYNVYIKQIKEKSKDLFLHINDSILFDDFNVVKINVKMYKKLKIEMYKKFT